MTRIYREDSLYTEAGRTDEGRRLQYIHIYIYIYGSSLHQQFKLSA